jgi:rsbT antagonist protein RsbS
MAHYADIPGVAMQVSRGVVVASIQVDLDDDVIARFRQDLLDCIHETGSRGVILDVSGLETLDSEELAALRKIMVMTSLMGAESVLVGLRPGVVSALIEVGAEIDGLRAAINLDAAFALLETELEPAPELESEDEIEPAISTDLDAEDDLLFEAEVEPEADW